MKIEFDEKEGKLFEEIIGLYSISKDIMIYAEEVGGESFSPATEEFRHAFDHLMRVFAFKLGFKQADAKYAIENLMPAYRHLYRAAYNLLDYLSIFFRDKVQDEMKSFSGETLQEIFPDYYKEIKPYFVVEAPTEISKLRIEKDIGKRNENDLNKYTEIVERFKSYYGEIIKIKPSLIEYEDEKRKKLVKDEDEKRKNRLLQIIIPSITAIIGAVIGWILTNLLIH
ncbi:MAG: hypothetical protein GQ523_08945 [Methanophagales archaeon]|jgi:hypothetical protein|nr:hypothetical protein [Methanophagales archaeon]